MNSNDYKIVMVDDEVKITINDKTYDISFVEPNGVGYAFVARFENEKASLDYCYKNHPGAFVKYKRQRFEMTDTEAIDEKRNAHIKIMPDGKLLLIVMIL